MPPLDGKEPVKATPFDAHDQVLRNVEPVPFQEYPKAIAHDSETGEPVIARDADHEAELLAGKEE